ncbi:hypothetical protein [Actinoplanes sp. TFC3]|uniref:hypothetical protein n=1 Tax=Actinoplanes sp. TFC3 TaxID=1710355 RepID=UPI000A7EA9B3|nr:hypothetical protein [Actinoplanes sp. TFC3]
MSISVAQAAAFFRDVVRHRTGWDFTVDEVNNRLAHALGKAGGVDPVGRAQDG